MISTTTPDATIFFTQDGTNPNANSTVYANPISVAKEGETVLRAMAQKTGLNQSAFASATYVITIDPSKAPPVTFSPPAGEYENPVPVGLQTSASGATICYTIDGSAPACNKGQCQGTSAQYSAGSPIPVDAPTGGGGLTVQAIACSPALTNSDPTQSIYSFKVADVTAEPPTETVVALNASIALHTDTASTPTNNVRIRYNSGTIGSVTAPTCSLFQNQGPNGAQTAQVTISQNTEIKAIACRGNYQDSDVSTFVYRVKLQTPVVSTTQPADGNNDNVVGSVTGVRYNAMTGSDAPVFENNAAAPNGNDCFRIGADPVCNAGVCDATGAGHTSETSLAALGAGALIDNAQNNIRYRQCAPNFIDSDVVQATYTFTVQNVAINFDAADLSTGNAGSTATSGVCGATPNATCYEPTSSANFYDLSDVGGNVQTFTFTTAKTGTGGNGTTGTVGEVVRIAYRTGSTVLGLPAPVDPTCDGENTGVGSWQAGAPAGETRVVCTPDTNTNCSIDVDPFTTIKARGCKDTGTAGPPVDYVPSPIRTLVYANPSQTVAVTGPNPPPPGPYFNDTKLDFTTSPPQPTATALLPGDVNVCWTQSLITGPGSIAPACDQVTGACLAPTGTTAPEDSFGRYNPCSGAGCGGEQVQATGTTGDVGFVKPLVYRTGTIVKAVACRAGVAAAPPVVTESQPYTLQVAQPTFDKPNGFVGFDTAINFATTTTGATIAYRRSDAQVNASDPSCTGPIAGQQAVANFINEFDQECADGLGSQCATPSEQVRLIGCKAGYLPSTVATGNFTANLAPPSLTPNGNPTPRGYNTNTQSVTLTAPFFTGTGISGGRVCYSTDGGTPTCGPGTGAAATCTGAGGVIQKATASTNISVGTAALPDGTVIRAIACADGFDPSPAISGTYNFRVQPYSIDPLPAAQSVGTTPDVRFVNTLPAANGTPSTTATCVGGTNAGATCFGPGAVACLGGGTCGNEPTTGAVVCYSTDATAALPDDCVEPTGPFTNQCVGGTAVGAGCTAANEATTCTGGGTCNTQRVFCSNGPGAGVNTFATANGFWSPAGLQDIASNRTVRSRACKTGFVPTSRAGDSYTFGTYSRAETIDGNNTFNAAENRISRSDGTWASTDALSETDDTSAATRTTDATEAGGGAMFVSWTANDIFVGFQGSALSTDPGSYFNLYVKGSGTGISTTGTTSVDNGLAGSPDEYGTTPEFTNPVATNMHFFLAPAAGTGSAGVRVYTTGGNWIVPATAPAFQVQVGGTFNAASGYVEWRIPRADIGLAAAGSRLVLTGSINHPNRPGPTAGPTELGIVFPVGENTAAGSRWGWLDADMGASLFPSARAYAKP